MCSSSNSGLNKPLLILETDTAFNSGSSRSTLWPTCSTSTHESRLSTSSRLNAVAKKAVALSLKSTLQRWSRRVCMLCCWASNSEKSSLVLESKRRERNLSLAKLLFKIQLDFDDKLSVLHLIVSFCRLLSSKVSDCAKSWRSITKFIPPTSNVFKLQKNFVLNNFSLIVAL